MWKVEYKKRFLKELSKLPEGIQARMEKTVFEDLMCENPFDLGYLEQMRGYPGKYKIRIGQDVKGTGTLTPRRGNWIKSKYGL